MRITTAGPRRWWLRRTALPAAAIGVLALAACGSSGGSTGSGTGTGTAGSSGTAVTIGNAPGGMGVLATAAGRTLYASDQEDGMVLCKSSACTAIWIPLTVSAGQTPAGPSQLAGKLSTMMRPDGKTQVALDGKPLYTFSFDHAAGQVTGDGQKDSFDGTDFTWHAATAAGGGSAPSAAASSSSSGGGPGYP